METSLGTLDGGSGVSNIKDLP